MRTPPCRPSLGRGVTGKPAAPAAWAAGRSASCSGDIVKSTRQPPPAGSPGAAIPARPPVTLPGAGAVVGHAPIAYNRSPPGDTMHPLCRPALIVAITAGPNLAPDRPPVDHSPQNVSWRPTPPERLRFAYGALTGAPGSLRDA